MTPCEKTLLKMLQKHGPMISKDLAAIMGKTHGNVAGQLSKLNAVTDYLTRETTAPHSNGGRGTFRYGISEQGLAALTEKPQQRHIPKVNSIFQLGAVL